MNNIDTQSEQYTHRNQRLIHYLNSYIYKKHIKMKPLMKSILEQLKIKKQISKRQLEVIVPYLKNDLKSFSLPQIYDFFSILIYNYDTVYDEDYLKQYHPNLYKEYEEHLLDKTHPLEKFMS